MKLYEKLADDIAQSIRTGTLRRGEKLPSVRKPVKHARSVRQPCIRPTICWKHAD